MAVSFLSPARTVLLVGDEALYVYKVTHNSVKLVDGIPWQTDDFDEVVTGLIRRDCGGRPVLIVNDMTDQHFKGGQRLPKVGLMDRGNVLKRKLQVAFPNYPIRGALEIKGKDKAAVTKEVVKGAGGLYLFSAVPVSDQIVKTLSAVKLSMAPIAGFTLLPVESSDLVRAMSEKMAGGSRRASKWVVFIGQHQNGALRQVITRDGQLAMTRMTPASDIDADPQVWANEVSQEFKATISYLSRFGYNPEEGTDVFVIAGRPAGDALKKLIEIPCNFTAYTAQEAARLVGIKIGMQEEPRYADPLHVGWIGRKPRFILPMDAPELTRVNAPRQAATAAMLLLFLGAGYLGWQLLGQAQEMVATRGDLSIQRGVLAQAESEYNQELARMEALGFDVKLIQSSIETYKSFEAERGPFLSLFKNIGQALGNDLRLDFLKVEQIPPAPVMNPATGQLEASGAKAQLEAQLALSFPTTVELEFGIREVLNLERRLQGLLPDYSIRIDQNIGSPEYTENLKGEVGRTAEEIAAADDYVARLSIRGPRQ